MKFLKYRLVTCLRRIWWVAALLGLVTGPSLYAQIGTWQSLPSYQSGQSVAVAGVNVYAATQYGFFYYDPATGQTVALTKGTSMPGLTDVGISRLLYLPDQNRLLIAYQSGQLDFLKLTATGEPGTVTSVSTIRTSPNISGSRTINHINRIGNRAYLSTDFGIVVLNLTTDDIGDTFFSARAILQTAVANDSLYALLVNNPAQTQPILRAIRLSPAINFADPANWRTVPLPAGETALTSLVPEGSNLLAAGRRGVYQRQTGTWTLIQPASGDVVLYPGPNGRITLSSPTPALPTLTVPGIGTFTDSLLTGVRETAVSNGRVYVADGYNGLLEGANGRFRRITPGGPFNDKAYGLYAYSQRLIKLPTSAPGNDPDADALIAPDNRWVRLYTNDVRSFGFVAAAYLPAKDSLYLGDPFSGLWRLDADLSVQPVTVPLPVQAPEPNQSPPGISALAADAAGNLWIGLTQVPDGTTDLLLRQPDGSVQAFVSKAGLQRDGNLGAGLQIVPDDNGFVWIRTLRGYLYVFDPQTKRNKLLPSYSNYVQTLVKDRTGLIWAGTSSGVTVFTDPASFFDSNGGGQAPLVNGRPLLGNVPITALAVDGGNRKWIGTAAGLYHVSPDGSQVLETFTADNSPLPSGIIQALAIEPVSGNVYIQTDKGLVAYRGPATEPAETLSRLTIFPNPVRPDYTGTVGINGLTDNATVKILDAGGMLVYETRSQGGTATWNLSDYRNRPAQTGIYLIVVVAADGSESVAGKLAVVR